MFDEFVYRSRRSGNVRRVDVELACHAPGTIVGPPQCGTLEPRVCPECRRGCHRPPKQQAVTVFERDTRAALPEATQPSVALPEAKPAPVGCRRMTSEDSCHRRTFARPQRAGVGLTPRFRWRLMFCVRVPAEQFIELRLGAEWPAGQRRDASPADVVLASRCAMEHSGVRGILGRNQGRDMLNPAVPRSKRTTNPVGCSHRIAK